MRRTITAAATAALALGLVAGPAAAGPKDNGLTTVGTAVAVSGTPNIFDDNGGDFDILVAAVLATGANDILDEGGFTVFAPTDQAFLDAVSGIAGTTVTDEKVAFDAVVATFTGFDDVPSVLDVLLYHVAPGEVSRSDIARKKVDIDVAFGPDLATQGDMIFAANSTAQLVDPTIGINTTDGQIYIIDTVLLP